MGDWERAAERGRVERCAESFQRLAEVFCYLPARKETLNDEDLEEIYETAKTNVCRECGKCQDCWGRNAERTARLVYDLLTVAAHEGDAGEGDLFRAHVLERFRRSCIRGTAFLEEVRGCFSRARLNLMWSNRLLENRAALARQLQETAVIIREVACTVFDAGEPDRTLEKKVKGCLKAHHIQVKDLRMRQNDRRRPELILTASAARGHCVTVRELASYLTQICKSPLTAERDSRLTLGHETATIHFVEETGFYMLTGAARKPAASQSACGDNFAVLTGNHGQVILGISDGMGCGAKANRESQTVIELLEQFLGAGFSAETAIRMINSTMMLRRGQQGFSTLDICMVDLYTGRCEFIKIGAAPTFIRRGGQVEVIASESLPVGVSREADCERAVKRLEHGDMVVMVTDGVLDALPQEKGEEMMRYLIGQIRAKNPAEFAQLLLDQVLALDHHSRRDDMTILAGGFWKK